jgi:hypothetical protein
MSRYVIHHETCYGRSVGRIPEGLPRSEYFSNPDRGQFEVGEISRSGSAYVIRFVRPVDGVPPVLRCETLPEVRAELDRLQPLPSGGRR